MTCIRHRAFPGTFPRIGLLLAAAAGIVFAQDQPPAPPQNPAAAATAPDPEPVDRGGADQAQTPPRSSVPPAPPAAPARVAPAYGLPAELTLKPGTLIAVRMNEMLSSNRSQPGDGFSGVLIQPLVVDGVVVAQRGQSVYGSVAAAIKSHANTPSQLGLELTALTLADGTQASVRSQMVSWEGGKTPAGMQAGTVIGTTAVGAGIGGAVGWGTGAAIGAGAGLAVGAIAALETRNRPTVVYPETAMTFRLDTPLLVSTTNAPRAFRYVSPNDYNRPAPVQTRVGPPMPPPYYGGYYAPYYAPYPYGYYPYAYGSPYFGSGFGVMIGRGFRH